MCRCTTTGLVKIAGIELDVYHLPRLDQTKGLLRQVHSVHAGAPLIMDQEAVGLPTGPGD
jgi:hypothetical protein